MNILEYEARYGDLESGFENLDPPFKKAILCLPPEIRACIKLKDEKIITKINKSGASSIGMIKLDTKAFASNQKYDIKTVLSIFMIKQLMFNYKHMIFDDFYFKSVTDVILIQQCNAGSLKIKKMLSWGWLFSLIIPFFLLFLLIEAIKRGIDDYIEPTMSKIEDYLSEKIDGY